MSNICFTNNKEAREMTTEQNETQSLWDFLIQGQEEEWDALYKQLAEMKKDREEA